MPFSCGNYISLSILLLGITPGKKIQHFSHTENWMGNFQLGNVWNMDIFLFQLWQAYTERLKKEDKTKVVLPLLFCILALWKSVFYTEAKWVFSSLLLWKQSLQLFQLCFFRWANREVKERKKEIKSRREISEQCVSCYKVSQSPIGHYSLFG